MKKMSALGTMASRLAHDIKNPLTVIKVTSDILSKQLDSQMSSEMQTKCMSLQDAVEDIQRLIDDTLNFVRTTDLNITNSSVKVIIENSLRNIMIPKTIVLSLPDNDVQLNCDIEKLSAVFSNLIINAVHAIGKLGTIDVKISDNQSHVIIDIIDSGSGIPANNLSKIFEPLFTTKTIGTGLGLNICKTIIEQHKGTISVTNTPTTFTIKIPKS